MKLSSKLMLLVLLVAPCQPLLGEDGILSQKPPFSKIVAEILDLRSQLQAGEFEYRMTFKEAKNDWVSSIQRGVYAYDDRVGMSLHVFIKSSRATDGESDIVKTVSGGVLVPPPEPSLYLLRDLRTSLVVVDPSRFRSSPLRPFDFRSFGVALIGDFLGNADFEKTVTSHFGLTDDKVILVPNDKLNETAEIREALEDTLSYNYGGSIITFDLSRDYWPVRQRLEVEGYVKNDDGTLRKLPRELQSGSDIDLVRFDQRWVPLKVKIMNSSYSYTIDFEWKKLNSSVDEMEITFDRANDLALSFEEERKSLVSPFREVVKSE